MDDDDLKLQHVEAGFQPRTLAGMSIKALGDYIAELEAEIARARDAIKEKEGIRGEAESWFKS